MAAETHRQRIGGGLLGVGALTFFAYTATHPHDDATETVTETVASMAAHPMWVLSHAIGFVAFILIGAGMFTLVRSRFFRDSPRPRWWAWALVAAAGIGLIEAVPHTLTALEAAELAAGLPAPITDAHLALQVLFTPAYGIAIAGLAAVGFGRVAHPVLSVLGIIGGVFLVPVGPLLWLTGDPVFGLLFIPAAGTWLFLVGVGVRSWRSAGAAQIAATQA